MEYDTKLTVDQIKKTAKTKNISIGEMLSCCKLSKNALSSMQSRGSWLQANNLAKIADELDCSVDYLLGRTDNPNSHKQTEEVTTVLTFPVQTIPKGVKAADSTKSDIIDRRKPKRSHT